MKKVAMYIVLVVLFTIPHLVSAARPDLNTLGTPIKVASVNIQDATIVSQTNNQFTISFTLRNGTGVQTGVKYGIRLQEETNNQQYVVDEKVYDETLTLPENSTLTRQVSYVAPIQLAGEYHLYVTSQNTSGLMYGVSSIGTVTLEGAGGVVIDPASCSTISSETESPITNTAVLSPAASLTLRCTIVNKTAGTVAAQPVFETRYQSVYGSIAEASGGANTATILSADEKKTVTLQMPVAQKPQRYVVKISFTASGEPVSNTIVVPYVISGASVVIQNATFDKTSYRAGEQANISIVYSMTGVTGARLSVALATKQGKSCAPEQSIALDGGVPVVTLAMSVSKTCMSPQVTVTALDEDGKVLDQQVFGVQSPSNNRAVAGIIAVIISILMIGILLKKKHALNAGVAIVIALPFALFVGPTVHADTYTYSPNGYRGSAQVSVNTDNSNYATGGTIIVTALITSNSPDSLPIYLTASTDGGAERAVIPVSSLSPYASTGTKSTTLTAPANGGSYTVDFRNYYESRLIMGSTSGASTSTPVCNGTLDPNSHGYYQPLPYNPNGPSVGSKVYLTSSDYDQNKPFNGNNLWYAMQYMYSQLGADYWTFSGTYGVQIDAMGKILATVSC